MIEPHGATGTTMAWPDRSLRAIAGAIAFDVTTGPKGEQAANIRPE
jgi:hypothetical protein